MVSQMSSGSFVLVLMYFIMHVESCYTCSDMFWCVFKFSCGCVMFKCNDCVFNITVCHRSLHAAAKRLSLYACRLSCWLFIYVYTVNLCVKSSQYCLHWHNILQIVARVRTQFGERALKYVTPLFFLESFTEEPEIGRIDFLWGVLYHFFKDQKMVLLVSVNAPEDAFVLILLHVNWMLYLLARCLLCVSYICSFIFVFVTNAASILALALEKEILISVRLLPG